MINESRELISTRSSAGEEEIFQMREKEWPFVSLIILNYNGKEWLQECFSSLSKMDYLRERFEVILGDNASSDDSIAWTKEKFPWVKVMPHDANYGFCKGNNLCAKQAKGEYLVFLNNDTFVTRDWLKNLVHGVQSEAGTAVACGKMLLPHIAEGKAINAAGGLFLSSGSCMDVGWMEKDGSAYDVQGYTGYACGAGLLVQKRFFLETGGFDEYYFFFAEDADLGFRAWLYGHKVLYVPSAVMYHYCGGTRLKDAKISSLSIFYLTRNALYFIFKNFELITAFKAFFLWHIKALLRVLYCLFHANLKIPMAVCKGCFDFWGKLPLAWRARRANQKNRRIRDRFLYQQHLLIGFLEEMKFQKKRLKNDAALISGEFIYEK